MVKSYHPQLQAALRAAVNDPEVKKRLRTLSDVIRDVKTARGGAYNLSNFKKTLDEGRSMAYDVAEQVAARVGGPHKAAILRAWCEDNLPPKLWSELQDLREKTPAPARPLLEDAVTEFRQLAGSLKDDVDLYSLTDLFRHLTKAPWKHYYPKLDQAARRVEAQWEVDSAEPPLPTLPPRLETEGGRLGA